MNIIKEQLENTLDLFDHPKLGTPYKGKVRDVYDLGDKLLMITSDRISAFDKVLSTIPYKGEILNRVANFWFEKTGDEIPNHVIDNPDPQVLIAKKTKPLPVEVIVRGYITGSLWRDFEKGAHTRYGIPFPDELKRDQKFDTPIITPTTKAEYGEHDEAISREEIVNGLVDPAIYEKAEEYALKLFNAGQEWALEKGLILVDTKYEFGIVNGELILVDEVHTPDSSRYWIAEEYEARSKPHRTILFTKISDDTSSIMLSISVNNKDELARLKERFDDYGEASIRIEDAFIKPLNGEISLNLRKGSFAVGN